MRGTLSARCPSTLRAVGGRTRACIVAQASTNRLPWLPKLGAGLLAAGLTVSMGVQSAEAAFGYSVAEQQRRESLELQEIIRRRTGAAPPSLTTKSEPEEDASSSAFKNVGSVDKLRAKLQVAGIQLQKLQEKIDAGKEELKSVQAEKAELEELLKMKESSSSDIVAKVREQKERDLAELKAQKERELEAQQQRLRAKEDEVERLTAEKEQEIARLNVLQEQEVTRLRAMQEQEVAKFKSDQEEELERLRAEAQQLQSTKSQLESQLEQQKAALEAEIQKQQAVYKQQQQKLAEQEKMQRETEAALKDMTAREKEEADRKLQQLQAQIEAQKRDMANQQAILQASQEEKKVLETNPKGSKAGKGGSDIAEAFGTANGAGILFGGAMAAFAIFQRKEMSTLENDLKAQLATERKNSATQRAKNDLMRPKLEEEQRKTAEIAESINAERAVVQKLRADLKRAFDSGELVMASAASAQSQAVQDELAAVQQAKMEAERKVRDLEMQLQIYMREQSEMAAQVAAEARRSLESGQVTEAEFSKLMLANETLKSAAREAAERASRAEDDEKAWKRELEMTKQEGAAELARLRAALEAAESGNRGGTGVTGKSVDELEEMLKQALEELEYERSMVDKVSENAMRATDVVKSSQDALERATDAYEELKGVLEEEMNRTAAAEDESNTLRAQLEQAEALIKDELLRLQSAATDAKSAVENARVSQQAYESAVAANEELLVQLKSEVERADRAEQELAAMLQNNAMSNGSGSASSSADLRAREAAEAQVRELELKLREMTRQLGDANEMLRASPSGVGADSEEMARLVAVNETLKKQVAGETQRVQQAKELAAARQKELMASAEKLRDAESRLVLAERNAADAMARAAAANQQLEAANSRLSELQARSYASISSTTPLADGEARQLAAQLQEALDMNDILKQQVAAEGQRATAAAQELFAAQERVKQQEETLKVAKQEVQALQEAMNILKRQVSQLVTRAREAATKQATMN